mgnify:FL=1
MKFFTHPKEVCMSYFEHMKLSLYFSWILWKASILAVIHAFLPDTFITSTSDTNKEVEKILKESGCKKDRKIYYRS